MTDQMTGHEIAGQFVWNSDTFVQFLVVSHGQIFIGKFDIFTVFTVHFKIIISRLYGLLPE